MNNQALSQRDDCYYLYKICRMLIIIGVVFTPFATLQVGWIPTTVKALLNYEEYLSMYPLLLFSIIWMVHTIRAHRIREYIPLGVFFIVYFIANMAVTIHGNLIFPYYDIADFAKLEGSLKTCLTTVTRFYSSYFIVFSIFLFYRETSFSIIDDIWLGITVILPVLAIYEIFEVAYLVGASWGTTVLKTINPLLYEMENSHGWFHMDGGLLFCGPARCVRYLLNLVFSHTGEFFVYHSS